MQDGGEGFVGNHPVHEGGDVGGRGDYVEGKEVGVLEGKVEGKTLEGWSEFSGWRK